VLQRLNARQLVDAGEILAWLESYELAIRMMDPRRRSSRDRTSTIASGS
jgi:hypothetical protein